MQDSSPTHRDLDGTLVEPPEKNPEDANADAVAGGFIGAAVGASFLGTFPGAPVGIGIAGLTAGENVPADQKLNASDQESYWRENHASQSFAIGKSYETYESAYRLGYEGYLHHPGKAFEDVEDKIRSDYESKGPHLPWAQAREAARAAWNHAHQTKHRPDYLS